ncbi:MAG TPA: antibiotic biosynthesis monooxygenase [Candidatus Binatia bacterium]|nr:antibiotic biosynthesis monooxygenase [Candidatus Binatia bacterium]
MVVVLFRSRLTAAAGEDYAARSAEMFARARSMPGYVDAKTFVSRDGERLTLIHWESAETLRAWAEDEQHRVAQAEGRARWYETYQVEVAEVVRRYGFERG